MADTRTQLLVEEWIRSNWLPRIYGQQFKPEHLKLITGGYFDFDAVSLDQTIVVNISTSTAITSRGKRAVGKIHKLHSDILYLQLVETEHRIILLTEMDMYEYCQKEKVNGRVPSNIEFVHAEISEELSKELKISRGLASLEVKPRNKE
jgi:hypothetical protein